LAVPKKREASASPAKKQTECETSLRSSDEFDPATVNATPSANQTRLSRTRLPSPDEATPDVWCR
jgi:hypothetical protein